MCFSVKYTAFGLKFKKFFENSKKTFVKFVDMCNNKIVMLVEILGIVATLFILAGFCFKTMTFWGSFFLRLLNTMGSIIFVVYGILLPAIATAVLNSALIVVNGYYLIRLIVERQKNKKAKTN